MSKSNVINKITGLFVEGAEKPNKIAQDGAQTSLGGDEAWKQWEAVAKGQTANAVPLTEVIAQQPGPNLDSVSVNLPAPADKPVNEFVMPKRREDNTWDFSPIYAHSNLTPPPFTAEQARDIIQTLPNTLSVEVKRETVSKTLGVIGKTLGITPEAIASDAALKIAAVEDFRTKIRGRFEEYELKALQAIAEHEKKIEETRASIANAKQRSAEVMNACDEEIDKLDDVTEFFTLDTGTSTMTSPV